MSQTFRPRSPALPRVAAGLAASLALGAPSAHAAPTPFPADFRSSQWVNADATITSASAATARGRADPRLRRHRRHVVADGRRAREGPHRRRARPARHGPVSHPAAATDKWTQAGDIRAVLDKLGIDRADIVGHDIGHDGRVCLRGALSGQDKPPGRDGLASARHPAVEPDRAPARVVALNFGGPDASAWSPAASASTSTASGTSSPAPVE